MHNGAGTIQSLLDWLADVIAARLEAHGGDAKEVRYNLDIDDSLLVRVTGRQRLSDHERAIIALALAPHFRPAFFSEITAKYLPEGGDFPEFGGVKGSNHRGILPTGETSLYVCAGNDLRDRIAVQSLFAPDHWFAHKRIVWLAPVLEGEPQMSGRLIINPEIIEEIVTGKINRPAFGLDFPAEYIETAMEWDDLVLNPLTHAAIRDVENWIRHNNILLDGWSMRRKIKPGYRALFHGPPGTGKTLTAMLLGKTTGRDVFRVDLSRVVSKYIGETEKNLSRLFDRAEHKDWILFFDEADSLFSKRTDIRDAHDKYANQEVSYLLQRIEGYNGLVILASNQRANIDEAFVRRLQAIVPFPMPRPEERLQIWRQTLPEQMAIGREVDLRLIAERHELSGASILNITHYCAIQMLADRRPHLDLPRLEAAIRREFIKEGKVV